MSFARSLGVVLGLLAGASAWAATHEYAYPLQDPFAATVVGTPRDVAGPVIEMLFPPGAPSRIPIAAITGTNGKTTTSRMLAHILKLSGLYWKGRRNTLDIRVRTHDVPIRGLPSEFDGFSLFVARASETWLEKAEIDFEELGSG